ncbi:MAG: hypothetical protein ABR925_07565 [Acidimicrobiales bacterium]|jgi:hypothetical protein
MEPARRRVPFGGHQVAEYALATALLGGAFNVSGRPGLLLLIGGLALALRALLSRGPLSVLKIVPRALHLWGDLLLAVAFALSPLLYMHDLQPVPIILSEAVAVVLVRMSLTTEVVPRPRLPFGRSGTLIFGRPSGASTDQSGSISTVATSAGRTVGKAIADARGSDVPKRAARGLGRAAGRARRLGREARSGSPTRPASAPRGQSDPPQAGAKG